MASLRFAVFGDSYVQRQGEFSQLPFEIKFIGEEDMNLLDVPSDKWDELIEYQPDLVLLHLGGNDIIELPRGTNQVTPLFNQMGVLVQKLRAIGARALVGEILPRTEFGLRDVSLKTFDTVRKGLNRRIRSQLKHDYIFFRVRLTARDGDLHYHYDKDGVHLSPSGMTNYDKALRKIYVGLT